MSLKSTYYGLVINQESVKKTDQSQRKLADEDVENNEKRLIVKDTSDEADEVNLKEVLIDELIVKKLPDPGFLQILKLNSPEWLYIVIGCIAMYIRE